MGKRKDGYVYVQYEGKQWAEHHLVWFFHTGQRVFKPFVIDHIDGNRSNNDITNLRVITYGQNISHAFKGSWRGIYLQKNGRYKASITVKQKYIHLGYFASFDEALAARSEAR